VNAETLAELARAVDGKGVEPIKRDALQDAELSFRARGVLGYLMSLPKGWKTNAERIAKEGKEGRDAIRTALAELEKAGYLIRHRHHVGGGVWEWTWVYGDSPLLVRIKFAERFPETRTKGAKGPTRARRRATRTPPPENPIVAGQSDVEEQVPTDGFSGGGKPGDGKPGDGFPGDRFSGDIERHSRENPPNPPQSGGSGSPPAGEDAAAPATCSAHGRRNCRACGLSPRAQARAAREVAAAAEAAELERMRACWRCDGDGWVWIRGVPISPPQECDHSTEPELVLARVRAAEEAAEQARSAPKAPGPRPPDPKARAAALEAARPRRNRATSGPPPELPDVVAGQV
jgi:hypothetical protein